MTAFAQIPYGSTVVVPMYSMSGGQPQILVFVLTDDVIPVPVEQVPAGQSCYVSQIVGPGVTFDAATYTVQTWSPPFLQALREQTRAAIDDAPARGFITPEPGYPEIWIGNPPATDSALLVVPTKAVYAQQPPRFITTLRSRHLGQVLRTTIPETSIPAGSVVWVSTRYSQDDGWVPDDTRYVPTRWTHLLRADLARDMTNRTEPEVGAWTTSWDRIPPRRSNLQIAALGIPSLILTIGGIPWGMAYLSVLGFFGLFYTAFWMLQTDPDPYERRRRVDKGRIVASAVAGVLSARTLAREGTVGAGARTAATAALLGLSVDSYAEHQREQSDRVR